MKNTLFLYLILISANCFSQEDSLGIHKVNNNYEIDSFVVLKNLNLLRLVDEIKKERVTTYKTRDKIPACISDFLKVASEDSTFSFANPNEDWNSGCVQEDGLADRQLQVFGLSKNFCILSYKRGGRGVFRRLLIFKLKGEEIVDFWAGIGSDEKTITGILKYLNDNIDKKMYNMTSKEYTHSVLNTNYIYL